LFLLAFGIENNNYPEFKFLYRNNSFGENKVREKKPVTMENTKGLPRLR